LLDQWLPPEGAGRPIGCLATTYTFDPDFFETQCAARFLGLDARADEGDAFDDLGFLIEREERFNETPVVVLADRRLDPEARSLRWDLLTVTVPTGVMHAKVVLLHWRHLVRLVISSANLVPASYRSSIEVAVAFDARRGSEVPRAVFDDLLNALAGIVRRAPGHAHAPGPHARAAEILGRARAALGGVGVPERPRRGTPRMVVTGSDGTRDALDQLLDVWAGGPPKRAVIMSPFYDADTGAARVAARIVEILSKRGAQVEVVTPLARLEAQTVGRVPRALLEALPSRVSRKLVELRQPDEGEFRRLHGKVVLLESDAWVAALVGSANATVAGLGIGGGGNLEVGLAIGTPSGTDAAVLLRDLALCGEAITEDLELAPVTEADELGDLAVPLGFVQVLADPGPPPCLFLELEANRLPARWAIATATGEPLGSARAWTDAGSPATMRIPLPSAELPLLVAVTWSEAGSEMGPVGVPVNVTDPSRLPPPAELRNLPIRDLIRALASSRPLHESLVAALRERARATEAGLDEELDPLRRFSPSGQLLHRTREMSDALVGLRLRLEAPVVSIDAYRWRVDGPFGPLAIGDGIIEAGAHATSPGERRFMLAELALTVSWVDPALPSRYATELRNEVASCLAGAVRTLRQRCAELEKDGREAHAVSAYVGEAFTRALR
jgi:hypothetical protein